MPEQSPIDAMLDLAHKMFLEQMDYIYGQVVAPTEPQRIARIGNMPAAPIVEQTAADILAGEGV